MSKQLVFSGTCHFEKFGYGFFSTISGAASSEKPEGTHSKEHAEEGRLHEGTGNRKGAMRLVYGGEVALRFAIDFRTQSNRFQ